jgi:hypothetical protein
MDRRIAKMRYLQVPDHRFTEAANLHGEKTAEKQRRTVRAPNAKNPGKTRVFCEFDRVF